LKRLDSRFHGNDRKTNLRTFYDFITFDVNYSSFNFVNLTLRVQIQDMAGHYSAPVLFPLSVNALYRQEPAPQNVFKEHELGPIMVRLRTVADGHSRNH
jgi:hypothetical protein